MAHSHFDYLYAEVIDHLLGLLPVQKFLRKRHVEIGNFYNGVASVVAGNSAPSFSPRFLHEHLHAYFRFHFANHSDLGIIEKIFQAPLSRSL